MKGYFRRRGCKCKKKRCTCGAKWSFTIDVGIDPATGKRKQKTKSGFKTKEEAEAAAAELHYELLHGTYIEEKDVLFKDFAQEWLTLYAKSGKVKKSTVDIRKNELDVLLKYFGKAKLKDISAKQYQNALIDLHTKGYSDNYISGIHAAGRMIFKKAIEREIIKKNPTQFAILPKKQKTVEELEQEDEVPKYLEKEELARFLKVAKEKGIERDYVIFLTLAYSGMRLGELCALKWKDIDFERQTISITKTYYNPKNIASQYQLLTPKTIKSKREIEIDQIVLDELEKLRAQQNIVKMRHRNIYHDEDFVFARTKRNYGYPEGHRNIEYRMKRLLKLAGLNETLTPHSLRHTHVSLLAEAGVGLQEIMDRMGHNDDQTTKNVYLHVTKTMKKEASQKFSALMRSL